MPKKAAKEIAFSIKLVGFDLNSKQIQALNEVVRSAVMVEISKMNFRSSDKITFRGPGPLPGIEASVEE
ncbi:hypothetical protein HAP41_0000009765 [Bradyrhizobium barranii subsp. apii]|uniref:Uncharacterized protein n=1 Tax=Bradyrhizobium barranii subsp. apii TaxID=2819348 RepID=A0A8T5VPK1_9BRAD|nr:hypothetical protein [Bradyrhizobium barranii]UPT89227.1 hypothetical protein HAP41_0000009765 [Bradyrhizobium barranii subsp. apii]UPT95015.1 hypothetical protein J4G48_0038155 [Bradyrhizobium barranii subsp. apii]